MPPRPFGRRIVRLAVACTLVVLNGCGRDGDDGTAAGDRSTSTTTTLAVELGQSCTHEDRGVEVSIDYPDGWFVNDGDAATVCSAFDPEPVNLARGTEYPPDLAVVVRIEPVSFDDTGAGSGVTVEDRRTAEVDRRTAARLEVVATGDGLRPAGERSIRWMIDAGEERTIIATTSDVEGNDFTRSVRVLDEMVRTLTVMPRAR